jgi:hypothetical protein
MKYPTISLIHIVCLSLSSLLFAPNAHAQNIDDAVNHVGLGVGMTFYNPTDNDAQTSQGIAVAYRWHSFHSGWGPTVGLDWHSTNFNQTLGDLNAPLGSLRMRAVLGGFGHTRRIKRFAASANVSAGYSFNGFTVSNDAFPRFATAGVSLVTADVDNSWVVRPGVTAWYDVHKHVGVGVGAAYMVNRPNATITTASGTVEQRLKADAVELTAGVTFGLWKNKP